MSSCVSSCATRCAASGKRTSYAGVDPAGSCAVREPRGARSLLPQRNLRLAAVSARFVLPTELPFASPSRSHACDCLGAGRDKRFAIILHCSRILIFSRNSLFLSLIQAHIYSSDAIFSHLAFHESALCLFVQYINPKPQTALNLEQP